MRNTDQLTPSDAALKELNMPEYLRVCDVVGRTTIRDSAVTYEVVVGDWIVWYRVCEFGHVQSHRAAGSAFVGIARQQEDVMHEWADKILFARDEVAR
jgi:hypothetical protein